MTEQKYKYLTRNKVDEQWGLYLNVAGSAEIQPHEHYPPKGHPDGYDFNWEKGRILRECQILYLVKGEGVFETREQEYKIKQGDLIILFPNTWHRYKPTKETGWKEYYIGFGGRFIEKLIENKLLSPKNPVFNVGLNETIINIFKQTNSVIESEEIAYQQIASSLVMQLLAYMRQIMISPKEKNNPNELLIKKARFIIRENLNENIPIESIAEELGASYSLFRKEFKIYTGLSPRQYQLQLKVRQCKNLLLNTNLSVKEIAFNTGFESQYYFSKMFKKQTGSSPLEYRKLAQQ
jgi:AraC-like DNA-binding protein